MKGIKTELMTHFPLFFWKTQEKVLYLQRSYLLANKL